MFMHHVNTGPPDKSTLMFQGFQSNGWFGFDRLEGLHFVLIMMGA